jgi:hypothetical protein
MVERLHTHYKNIKAKYYRDTKKVPKTIGQRHENHNNYSNVRHKENGRGMEIKTMETKVKGKGSWNGKH